MADLQEILDLFDNNLFLKLENYNLLAESWKKPSADWVISLERDSSIFAIIVKTSEAKDRTINRSYGKRLIKEMVLSTEAWYGILLDGDKIFLFKPTSSIFGKWQDTSIDGIMSENASLLNEKFNSELSLKNLKKILYQNDNKALSAREQMIRNVIRDKIEEILKDKSKQFKNHVSHFGRLFSLSLTDQFDILTALLKNVGVKPTYELCRYTSLGNLTRHLSDSTDSMCGLAVMNDKSEGFYLEKCLSSNASFNIYNKAPKVIDEYNKAFITSLCNIDKADDLTMWRLYGGTDGDGCCLVYEPNINLIRKSNSFILMPVCYANHNNILIQLFRYIRKTLPFVGLWQFGFSHMSAWSYFVKPQGFEIENEFRLLFLYDEKDQSHPVPKWILNDDKNIFFPIVVFGQYPNKVQYPLTLRKIIIGPKCKESHVNRVQLKQWIKALGLTIEVEESKIDFYR